MRQRDGVTLMEVLVAIFIMGIGMLAMLVLFPLGILRMSQSLQAERCAQACKQATAIGNFQGVRNDPWVLNDSSSNCPISVIGVTITSGGSGYAPPPAAAPTVIFTPAGGSGSGLSATALVNTAGQVTGVVFSSYGAGYTNASLPISVTIPGGSVQANGVINPPNVNPANIADSFTLPGFSNMLPADPNGPSYPVFVDPMGYSSSGSNSQIYWVAGVSGNSNTIPRRTTQYAAPSSGLTLRWTCLLDEIPFAIAEAPPAVVGGPQYDSYPSFTRDIRYCWAYMLKRPRTSDHSVVDMSVVVYNSRPILSSVFNEYLYQASAGEVNFDPVGNSITIDVTTSQNVVPSARPGDWLLDASYIPSPNGKHGTVNGYFYRVVGVTQNSETSYTFEVQQTLRNMPATLAYPPGQKIIFLEGVAEVFEKGAGRTP